MPDIIKVHVKYVTVTFDDSDVPALAAVDEAGGVHYVVVGDDDAARSVLLDLVSDSGIYAIAEGS